MYNDVHYHECNKKAVFSFPFSQWLHHKAEIHLKTTCFFCVANLRRLAYWDLWNCLLFYCLSCCAQNAYTGDTCVHLNILALFKFYISCVVRSPTHHLRQKTSQTMILFQKPHQSTSKVLLISHLRLLDFQHQYHPQLELVKSNQFYWKWPLRIWS